MKYETLNSIGQLNCSSIWKLENFKEIVYFVVLLNFFPTAAVRGNEEPELLVRLITFVSNFKLIKISPYPHPPSRCPCHKSQS